ncbi:unnamed protein product [Coccothraustes coccothraustes]
MALSECECQMCWPVPSITRDQAHSPKHNKRTLTSTTPQLGMRVNPRGQSMWDAQFFMQQPLVFHLKHETLPLMLNSFVICMRPKSASSMGSPETSIFQLFPTVHGENGSSCDEWELPPEYPSRGRRGVYGEHVGSYGETEEGMPQSTYST